MVVQLPWFEHHRIFWGIWELSYSQTAQTFFITVCIYLSFNQLQKFNIETKCTGWRLCKTSRNVHNNVRLCCSSVSVQVIENAVFAFKQPPTLVRHIAVTCVVVILTVLVSLLTDCVGIVLELNVRSLLYSSFPHRHKYLHGRYSVSRLQSSPSPIVVIIAAGDRTFSVAGSCLWDSLLMW